MQIFFTKIIPLQRFAAINILGILFAPKGTKITRRTIHHEAIHTAQMKEMFYVFFYCWYLIEWIIRLFGKGNAYRNIAFEKEAYNHDQDRHYLKKRKPYSWLKLLFCLL